MDFLNFILDVLVSCYSLFVAVEAGRAIAATDEDTVEIFIFAAGGVAGMKLYNLTTGNRQIGGRTSQTTGVTTL